MPHPHEIPKRLKKLRKKLQDEAPGRDGQNRYVVTSSSTRGSYYLRGYKDASHPPRPPEVQPGIGPAAASLSPDAQRLSTANWYPLIGAALFCLAAAYSAAGLFALEPPTEVWILLLIVIVHGILILTVGAQDGRSLVAAGARLSLFEITAYGIANFLFLCLLLLAFVPLAASMRSTETSTRLLQGYSLVEVALALTWLFGLKFANRDGYHDPDSAQAQALLRYFQKPHTQRAVLTAAGVAASALLATAGLATPFAGTLMLGAVLGANEYALYKWRTLYDESYTKLNEL